MTVKVRKAGSVCVLDVSGKIVFGLPATLLRDKCKELLAGGERSFVINMTQVPWIDSSGVGEVIACRNRIMVQDGRMAAVLKDKVHDIFTMFELQRVIHIYTDLEAALASFAD